MYVIKLFYSRKNDMEDIILCSADRNNLSKMFYTCIKEIEKHLSHNFTTNEFEGILKIDDLYVKIYIEELNKKYKETDKIKDVILKINTK